MTVPGNSGTVEPGETLSIGMASCGRVREGKGRGVGWGGRTLRYILMDAPSSACFAFPSRVRRVTTLSFCCGVVVNWDEAESGGLGARLCGVAYIVGRVRRKNMFVTSQYHVIENDRVGTPASSRLL